MAGGGNIEPPRPPCSSTNWRPRSHSSARRPTLDTRIGGDRSPAPDAFCCPDEIPRLLRAARRRGARPGRLACQARQRPTAAPSVAAAQGGEAAATFDSRCVSLGRQELHCAVTQDRMALATSVACESSIGPHHEPGDVLHDARDEQAAADETTDPQHRLVSTRLQSLSEVGVPRFQPSPTGDMAQEE